MPRSSRFRDMESALSELRKQFLPRAFDPTGTYSTLVLARARAYRVLAHAEVEHYLEDRVREIALHALSLWKVSEQVSAPLLALVAFSGRLMDLPPDSLSPSQKSAATKHDEQLQLGERVNAASKCFFAMLGQNHGVKEPNLLRLLIPIGFKHSDFDPLWLTTMNTFGEARGEAAHSSAKVGKVTHPPDPQSEHKTVQTVMVGLKDIDKKLTDLKL